MNWIILIVAGLFETAFAFCLGKMKGKRGEEYRLWALSDASLPACGCLLSLYRLCPLVQPIRYGRASERSGRYCLALHASMNGLLLPASSLW